MLGLLSFSLSSRAQAKNAEPSLWLGVTGGANFNFYHGYTSALNGDINISPGMDRGHGVGGFFGGVIEYHHPGGIWGLMLQQGGDNRRGNFENSGRRLEAKISYFTIEPSLLILPRGTHFYAYVGPRLGLLWQTRFTYRENATAPTYPQRNLKPKAYIKNLDKVTASMQVGVGYNLRITSKTAGNPVVVAPFITYLPSLNQNLRTIENLKLNTIRAGIVLKVGSFSAD